MIEINKYSVIKLIIFVGLFAVACSQPEPTIYFTSDRDDNLDIYSVGIDTKEQRNLTQSGSDEFGPLLSPDGRLVAFLSENQGNIHVEVIESDANINESTRYKVASAEGIQSHRWSPDSKRIAYVSVNRQVGNVYVTDVDDNKTMFLTGLEADEVGSWSRNGKSIVFAVHAGPKQGIYIRNPDGVNEFRLTEYPDFSPVWSPNGRNIAFISTRDDSPEIYMMDAEGKDLQRLTNNTVIESSISWSPDGQRILFVSGLGNESEIYTVRTDKSSEGRIPVRLTYNEVMEDQPVWSPGGDKIAFVSYLDGDAEIFFMSHDGKDQVRLTDNEFEDTDPTW